MNTMETTTALPAWIGTTLTEPTPAHTDQPLAPRTAHLALMEQVYLSIWETTLDRVSLGHKLKDIISDDPREIDLAAFSRWVAKDKSRSKALNDAKRMGTHFVLEDMIDIADGMNSMEDVARSTLRVNTRRLYLKAYNKDTFGDNPLQGEHTSPTISINIGAVESPYAKPSLVIDNVTTVENKADE